MQGRDVGMRGVRPEVLVLVGAEETAVEVHEARGDVGCYRGGDVEPLERGLILKIEKGKGD